MTAQLFIRSTPRNDRYNSDMHTMVLSTRTRCLAAANTSVYARDDLRHLGERRMLLGEDRWTIEFLPQLEALLGERIEIYDRGLIWGYLRCLRSGVQRTPTLTLPDGQRYTGFAAITALLTSS